METMVIIKLIVALLWVVGTKLSFNLFVNREAKLAINVSEFVKMTNKLTSGLSWVGFGVELAIYACCILDVFGSWSNTILYIMIGCDILGMGILFWSVRYMRKQAEDCIILGKVD